MCNCRWTEGLIAAVILIVTVWPGLLGAAVDKWVVIIAALALLLHSVLHHSCSCAMCCGDKGMAKKKKRK